MLAGVVVLLALAGPLAAPGSALDPPGYPSPQTIRGPLDRVFATDNDNLYINGVDDKRVDVDIAVIDSGIILNHPDLAA